MEKLKSRLGFKRASCVNSKSYHRFNFGEFSFQGDTQIMKIDKENKRYVHFIAFFIISETNLHVEINKT